MTKIQSMVRSYMQLPWHVRIGIEGKLGLLESGDSSLPDHDRLNLIFTRVKERDLIDKLIAEIEALNPPATEPITHLQAQGERLWREVDVKERLPEVDKGNLSDEYSISVTAFDKDGESYYGYFRLKTGLFFYRQIEGREEGFTKKITHWLEEIPAPAPENEAVKIVSDAWDAGYKSAVDTIYEKTMGAPVNEHSNDKATYLRNTIYKNQK